MTDSYVGRPHESLSLCIKRDYHISFEELMTDSYVGRPHESLSLCIKRDYHISFDFQHY